MKETLIVSNHPPAWVIAPHVLRLFREADIVLLTTPFFAQLVHLASFGSYDALPITGYMPGSTKVNDFIIRAFMATYGKNTARAPKNPVAVAAQQLASGRNLLIFPSGVVQKDHTQPEVWQRGAARILQQAYQQNPAISLAFLHIVDRTSAEVSEPLLVAEIPEVTHITGNSRIDSKAATTVLHSMYDSYYGLTKK